MFLTFLATHLDSSEIASDFETVAQTATTSDVTASFTKMMATFALLIVLLFATYMLIKYLIRFRLEKGVGRAEIQIVEKKMLSPKTMLYLVEVDHKKILIAESQLEIKKIESFDLSSDDQSSIDENEKS